MVNDAIRQKILEDPGMVLDDQDVVRALIGANSAIRGRNIVDLRAVLIDRLEDQLGELEDTHRDVVAAAYENLAGTHQIHRALLSVLAPQDFGGFLQAVSEDVPRIMALDAVKLCFEGDTVMAGQAMGPKGELRHTILGLPRGGVAAYCGEAEDANSNPVKLRPTTRAGSLIYRDGASTIMSEAILKLDLGPGNLPGILVFGSRDVRRFHGEQGTDLLQFFAAAFSAVMQRWLN